MKTLKPSVIAVCGALATLAAQVSTSSYAQTVSTIAGNGVQAVTPASATPATSGSIGDPSGITRARDGKLLVAAYGSNQVVSIDQATNTLARYVGSTTGANGATGDGTLATSTTGPGVTLGGPRSVQVDGLGNTYITQDLRVRKIDAAGIISTLYTPAGGNSLIGWGSVDANNNYYFTERRALNGVLNKITPAGVVSIVAGPNGDAGNGNLAAVSALLQVPGGVAVATDGVIFLTTQGCSKIRKITNDGRIYDVANPIPACSRELKVDLGGNLYFAAGNTLRKITRNGTASIVMGAAATSTNTGDGGASTEATIDSASGLHIDPDGSIFVTSGGGHVVRKITAPTMSLSHAAGALTARMANTALTGTMTFRENGVDIPTCGDVTLVAGAASCTIAAGDGRKFTATYSGMPITSTLGTGYETIGASAALTTAGTRPPSIFTALVTPSSTNLGTISPAGEQTVPYGGVVKVTVAAMPRHVMRISSNCDYIKTNQPTPLVPNGTGTDTYDVTVNGACSFEATFTPLIPKVNVNTEAAANTLFTTTERADKYTPPTTAAQTSGIVGKPVTFKAWVTDIAGVYTASASNVISFKANGVAINGCSNVPLTLRNSNVLHIREANCTTAFSPAGNVTITSEFAGDTYNFPATSSVLNHSVVAQ